MDCHECKHLLCTMMVVRGVMDCDPPEEYCELDLWPEEDECEKFEQVETYEEYMQGYEDYLIQQWEVKNDR